MKRPASGEPQMIWTCKVTHNGLLHLEVETEFTKAPFFAVHGIMKWLNMNQQCFGKSKVADNSIASIVPSHGQVSACASSFKQSINQSFLGWYLQHRSAASPNVDGAHPTFHVKDNTPSCEDAPTVHCSVPKGKAGKGLQHPETPCLRCYCKKM